MSNRLWPALRLGLLDMRGDLRRFVLLVVSLAMGTALIAGVSSVGAVIDRAIQLESATLMGGDLELSRADRPATAEELALLAGYGTVVDVVDTNLRARAGEREAFVDLSVVGARYPLLGAVRSPELPPGTPVAGFLAPAGDAHGALVDPLMLDQLGIAIGDRFDLGGALFEVRGTLAGLPDAQVRGFRLGLPALITATGFTEVSDRTSPLPGLGTWFRYKLLLASGTAEEAKAALEAALAGSGWTLRTARDGLGDMVHYYDLFMRFLLVVGLGSLLVGGVSVWSGMRAYVAERAGVVAVLRSLGATAGRVFAHFFTQVAALAAVGVGAGVLIGGTIALLALPAIGRAVGIALAPAIDWPSILVAAGAGLVTAFAFAYLPLQRTQSIRPVYLFRAQGLAPPAGGWRGLLGSWAVLPVLLAALAFFVLAWLMTGDALLVAAFGAAAALSAVLFQLCIAGIRRLLHALPEPRFAVLRHAVRAITGAPASTSAVVVSIGLALAMLVVVLVLQNNLRQEYLGASVFDAPGFVASDLFDDEIAALEELAATGIGITRLVATPMLRATLVAVNGEPAAGLRTRGPEASFFLSGEVPTTFRGQQPAASRVVEGEWWPEDHAGPGLVSLHQSLRAGLGVDIGDRLTFSLFGDRIEATVASFRDYSWQGGTDFLATFSPGVLEDYPSTLFAAVTAAPGRDAEVERALARTLPDIHFIAIGDTLEQVANALGQLNLAVLVVGGLAVGNGLIVLVGSLATGRRQREADAVIAKVLGATRLQVLATAFVQFFILAIAAAVPALALGLGLGWLANMIMLDVFFTVNADALAVVLGAAILITGLLGCITILRAISRRPARLLREL